MSRELDAPYPLEAQAVAAYRADGFVHLRRVLSPETLERFGREISSGVPDLNTLDLPMEARDTYQKTFLQVMNLARVLEPRQAASGRTAAGIGPSPS